MLAQMLRIIEPQENIEQLKAQLRAELDECTEAKSTGRNHLMEFMVKQGIWHIAELDYHVRERFEQHLSRRFQHSAMRQYIGAYDRVVQHAVRKNVTLLVKGKQVKPPYSNTILYLPYHPNQQVAMRFLNATLKKDYVWDFERKAPESMKRQIYDILHYSLENDTENETVRVHLLGLQELYDFCTEEGIDDIEAMELDQVQRFISRQSDRMSEKLRQRAFNFCRGALFKMAEEINWNANVWYMERIYLQPERVDEACPVKILSFIEVTHRRNREMLKQYTRYGLGITNLSIKVLRTEHSIVRGFLEEMDQSEDTDICKVTPQQMDAYFKKEAVRGVQAETYNKKVMSILHFFNFLKVRQYIERIPFDEDHYLKKTFAFHHDRSVAQETANEILEKLNEFPEDLRLMFLHLWAVGLRISEVCALKGNAYYIQGEDTWMQVYQTKMKRYKRIPIPEALYKLMQVYIKKYGIKADDYIFKNTKGGAYRSGTFRSRMLKHCEICNIQNGEYVFKAHDFRHSVATYFYDSGVPLQSIRDYLGHDYEEMTQQYVDFVPKRIDKASQDYFSQHSLASCLRKG